MNKSQKIHAKRLRRKRRHDSIMIKERAKASYLKKVLRGMSPHEAKKSIFW